MFNHDQATPQAEFNKKLHKREKKLRERLLEAKEEQARAQERLQRAEARLQKRLARVQRLENRLAAIQQHQTQPLPEADPSTTSTEGGTSVGASFTAPAPTPTAPPQPATDAAPAPPQPATSVEAETATVGATFTTPTAPELHTIEIEQAPIIHTEPLPLLIPTPAQPEHEHEEQTPNAVEQAQPATVTLEKTEEPPIAATALPPWARQELTTPSEPDLPPTAVGVEPSVEATVGASFSAPTAPSVEATVGASFSAPTPTAPTSSNEATLPPIDMDEEAGYGPTLAELFQSNEHAYEPQAPAIQTSTIASPSSPLSTPSTPNLSNAPIPTLSIPSTTPPALPTPANPPNHIVEAQTVSVTSEPSTETSSAIADISDASDASDARAVATATEQNTRIAANRALAIEEHAQQIDTSSQSQGETEQEPSASSAISVDSEHNLISPELASTAKALSISQLDEEEEEVEMLASTMVSDAAAAVAAEAEAAAEASSARTREARRMAEDAELMLHQVRMAIERGVLRGEDAVAALHFTEREATRAHAVLSDAEAAETEAVRTAMNAEAEAEVAEGMSIAIEKRNDYDERMRIYDEAVPVDGVLLDELPDDDETVEIPIIQPRENL